jgi:hypothetical protein
MKKSGKINTAPRGISFLYEPRPAPGRTPCGKCDSGHVVWTGNQRVYHFECSRKECDWTSKPLTTGNGKGTRKPVKLRSLAELRPALVPEIVRPAKQMNFKPWTDVSFISETATTITIRHRDGEILTVPKNFATKKLRQLHARWCES